MLLGTRPLNASLTHSGTIVSRLGASKCHLCYEVRYPLTGKFSRLCLVGTIDREIEGCLERKCRASKGHGACEASRHAFWIGLVAT